MALAGQHKNYPSLGFDWAGLGRLYLFFFFFSGLTHLLLQLTGATIFVGLRQAILMSLLWLVPVLLFPHKTRAIAAVLGFILWFFSLFSLGYFFVYRQEFSQSVIFIMFESNQAESSEYLAQYFQWWMIPALLAYTAVAIFLWKRIRPVHLSHKRSWAISGLILLSLFGYPLLKELVIKDASANAAFEKLGNRMEPAVPWQMIIGYMHYREQLANMEQLLESNSRIPPLPNLQDATAGKPATLVLVIGESTDKHHLSLYGYARKTTPKLDAMRDQLAVFNHVVSPRPFTIEALQQVLTFADQENPDLYLTRPSLMNMMKQAGYKSYWITNQQTMTKRNTMLTNFSRQTDQQIYLNNSRAQNSRQYDSSVLQPFADILKDSAPRKFIVIHLLGTHMKYEYRYPPEYDHFKDRTNTPAWLKDEQLEVYNDYDNAVLFGDHVLSSLIENLSASRQNGFLMFLSDHGEDVFETPPHDFVGRNEAAPTLPMYSIPLLLWTSEQWRAEHPRNFAQAEERPYSMSHFIHTWADLAGLRFDGFDASKSLVNDAFKERPLLVGNPYAKKKLLDMRTLMHKSQDNLAHSK